MYIVSSVAVIGAAAFSACENLNSVSLPFVGTKSDGKGTIDYRNAFSGTKLKEITIRNEANLYDGTGAYGGTFSWNKALKKITLPNNVTRVGDYTFKDCTSLTDIIIPDSVTSISATAFSGCGSLNYNVKDNVKYLGNESNLYLVAMGMVDETAKSLVIADSCKVINNYAFYGCTSLTTINFKGTEEEWNAISKASVWNYNTGNYTIVYNYR